MANGKELKPVSYRLDESVKEKFKEIAEATGGNQQETMQLLINAYLLQTQKVELIEHKATIEEFERYTTNLQQMFTDALRSNHNMRESVMQEFSATIESKDKIIQELQEKQAELKKEKENAATEATTYKEQAESLNGQIKQMENSCVERVEAAQRMLEDKEKLNKALLEATEELKKKLQQIDADVQAATEMREKYADLEKKNMELAAAVSKLEKALEEEKERHQSEVELIRQQEEIKANKLLVDQQRTQQEEINKYQEKYYDLLSRLEEKKGI